MTVRRPLGILLGVLFLLTASAGVASAADRNYAPDGEATASSTFPGYAAAKVNDGDPATTLGAAHSWCNNALVDYPPLDPQWVQVELDRPRDVRRIVVFTTDGYELRDFDLQILFEDESDYETVETVTGNQATSVEFADRRRDVVGVRVLAKHGPDHQPGHVRVNEIQVWNR
ncbi:hypothetical protein GCM10022243_13800 [Saccharothrix violaceirubra]|uniref:F5/8 type C domain-containing protein n=1 Tax=Saccharothrix violaceirubra TaxID=413306 RepID=A0A7W7T632_9PSEU|nr:discoidin domain-containing protein [Saccharothrix violaceirubra]MBB4967254.1 hypothetical protein [Saccharothrix violaceirubra]